MNRQEERGFAGARRWRRIQGVLPAVCFLLLVRAAAWASPPLPDASAFAGEDQIIEQYFEIRGLRITFEILPLESYVALKRALDLKAMGEARRGSQQQLLALAQAHRDGRADAVPELLFLDGYGLVVNAAVWDRTRLRGWRGVGGTHLSDIEKRLMALGGPSPSKSPPHRAATPRSPAVAPVTAFPKKSPEETASIGVGFGVTPPAPPPPSQPDGVASIGLGMGPVSRKDVPGKGSPPSGTPNLELAAEAARGFHYDPELEKRSEAEVALLTEALFFDGDPDRAREQLALEEAASSAAGDGSRLEIVDVEEPAVPPVPEGSVAIRVRVANRAESGPPAVFELGIWDYHRNNATVTRREGLRLGPEEEKTFVLTLLAPRAEAFGGYVYLDPLNDTRPEYPVSVLNFDVAWDRNTMTDEEVLSLLRDRIPDMRYTLSETDGTRWVAAYRERGEEAILAFQSEVMARMRDLEDRLRLEALNDPDHVRDLEETLAAEENTRRLAEFRMVHAWAVRQGERNDLDLVDILEDYVYIDDNARVHGNLQAARGAMLEAVRRKNAETTSVERYLLDYGQAPGAGRVYERVEPLVTPGLAASRFVDMNEGLLTHMGDRQVREMMADYRRLMDAYRDAGTDPRVFQKDLEALRKKMAFADQRLGGALTGRAREAYAAYRSRVAGQLDRMDDLVDRAVAFQKEAGAHLAKARGVRLASKGLTTLGDAWDWYDLYQKAEARVRAGEDPVASLGKEYGVFKIKALVNKVPVISAADAVMTGTGQLLYLKNKELWDDLGIDPRQYNAATLAEMGGGLAFAYMEDRFRKAGARGERIRLTAEERALLERRLELLEARMAEARGPEIRERLSEARRLLREHLKETL